MGNMRFYDAGGNPDTSTNWTETGEAIVSAQGDLIYAGRYEVTCIAANTTVFTFNGVGSAMKGNRDFMVIWCQNWQTVIYPDKDGNIVAGAASWVQGDEYLEWDETPESDILLKVGQMPGEGKIAAMLANHLLEEESDDITEIASKVFDMILMVTNWS